MSTASTAPAKTTSSHFASAAPATHAADALHAHAADSEHRPEIAVIDPGMGNLRSVCRAWEAAGAKVRLARTPQEVGNPAALIFPGQGGMPHCMDALSAKGFDDTIRGWIGEDRPFFGICLGQQVLFEHSDEGNRKGLGIFSGRVVRFPEGGGLKIPHMGWNTVAFSQTNKHGLALTDGLSADADQFYFVHSYHVTTDDQSLIWAKTDYGYPFVSAIARGNCFATQFHPEKSQGKGLQMYRNYVKWLNR